MTKIFTTPHIRNTTLIVGFIKLGYMSFYYTSFGTLERTGFNLGLSMLIIGIAEFIGYKFCHLIIKNNPRKQLLRTSCIVKATMGMGLAIDYLEGSPTLSSLLVLLIFLVDCVQLSAISML